MRLLSKSLKIGEQLSLGLYVNSIKSDPEVRFMDIRKRGCLFDKEVYLIKNLII